MHAWSSRFMGLWQAVLFVLFASVAIGPHALWDDER
jgi:hypothetical protein